MLKHNLGLKIIKTIEGLYNPREDEILQLTEIAKLNKLYLAFLRSVDSDNIRQEYLVEEAKFRRYMRNVVDVIKTLNGLRYALYKFRKPVDHVSVDLDILIHVDDIPRAVSRLKSIGFKIDIVEPYTATLRRGRFIVDLYTYPAFAWIIYMDGQKLLKEYSEDIEVDGVLGKSLTRDAEVVVTSAHAIYKEHIVLLLDCLTIRKWFSRKVIDLAKEFAVEKSVEMTLEICKAIERGVARAPYRVPLPYIARLYLDKMGVDLRFRATSPNIIKYLVRRRHSGYIVFQRLVRQSY